MRVFLDANILVSASKSDGPIATLVQLIVVHVAIGRFERLIATCTTIETPAMTVRHPPVLDGLPAKDQPVLAAAIVGRCQTLVTGDRRPFGSGYGRTFEGVAIHSPSSLYRLLVA